MSIHWILCLAALLTTPALDIILGLIRSKGLPVGAKYGYKTILSLSSKEAWTHAQHASGMRYVMTGIVMGIASLLIMLSVPDSNTMNLYIFSVTLFLTQSIFEILLISSVESELRTKFSKKAVD